MENPEKQATVTGTDPERLARIPVRMKEFVEQGTIAGAVTLVARHGMVASLEAVGYQDLETKRPMRTDTIFQIRSMTKPVTAVGVMTLIEEGRLGLLDPVEKHLPEFRGISVVECREGREGNVLRAPSRAITIYDLLTHTSGMLNELSPEDGDWRKWALAWRKWTLADEVAIFPQQPLEFDPGTKFQYSDAGFHTLGRIIEVVSEQPYENFIAETIFEPLGMKDSSFFLPPAKLGRIASPYSLVGGKLKKAEHRLFYREDRKNPGPSWGMLATASDLLSFHQMMLNGGRHNGTRIVSRASVEAMTKAQTGDLEDLRWQAAGREPVIADCGLGWVVARRPRSVLRMWLPASIGSYGHGGVSGTWGWVDPKKDLIGIFLIQLFPGDDLPFRNPEELNAFMATAAAIAD